VNLGEVWTVGDEGARWRVVVMSAAEYNEHRGWSYCVPIVRRPKSGAISPYAVALGEPDPVSGIVVVDFIERIPAAAATQCVGIVSGASFAKVEAVFRDLFDLERDGGKSPVRDSNP
jgi:mRNA-degrading endonuclease toxin of MazEF toxin-antitoxin module